MCTKSYIQSVAQFERQNQLAECLYMSRFQALNPLSPHDALKHHFTFFIFLQLGVL